MSKIRTIQKGNVTEGGFDIRITEPNGKEYYYNFLKLEEGNAVICSTRSFRIKDEVNISWEELPIEVRERHYKELNPKENLTSYEKSCFLYGKDEANKILDEERRKERDRLRFDSEAFSFHIPFLLATKIYDEIGIYEKVEILKEGGRRYLLLIDDKYIVKAKYNRIISIRNKEEEPAQKKDWGDRINEIANLAGTSFKFATIVAEISNTEQAVKTLKKVHKEIMSEKFKIYMKESGIYYDSNLMYIKDAIRAYLYKNLSEEYTKKLNISKKFCNAVKEEVLKRYK